MHQFNDTIMNDAAAVITICSRLLSNLRTLTETDARAAVAACEAWLKENRRQPQALVSHSARSRLPQEILNLILRKIPYELPKKTTLLACSSVNKEWRRISWRHVWKQFHLWNQRKDLAAAARYLSFPWALEVTTGVEVRDLWIEDIRRESLDNLALLLATPMFSGIRVMKLGWDVSTLHLLVALRSLPNLISLHCWQLIDWPVAWGESLQLDETKENEAWRVGLGNLRVLSLEILDSEPDGFMLDKLAAGLGSKLESLRLHHPLETEQAKGQFGQLLRNLSDKCPNLVDFEFGANTKVTDSLTRFIRTQQQLVHLSLTSDRDVSDDLIRTIAASCLNLKCLKIWVGEYATTRCLQYLATGPYLRALQIRRYYTPRLAESNAIAEKDIVQFLQNRGKNLEHFEFPNDPKCALAPLIPFLPNIRNFGTQNKHRYKSEDVIAFLNGAKTLRRFWIENPQKIPKKVSDVAIARKVELLDMDDMPDYVESKKESWMGL
ncbi:hypothetical protein HK104_009994 [Borealophlyctis nickersoniae]|nr:hypothetical protein HK104_009994 [Borealophlyctis nickersoniae]